MTELPRALGMKAEGLSLQELRTCCELSRCRGQRQLRARAQVSVPAHGGQGELAGPGGHVRVETRAWVGRSLGQKGQEWPPLRGRG